MIEIDRLVKRFGEKTAVDIDRFAVGDGEILGLVGNNGAGKTTLFRLLLDLLKADGGHIEMSFRLDGGNALTINPVESEQWKLHTGAYIDEGFLIDFLTPEEYFEFIGKTGGMEKEVAENRVKDFDAFMGGEIMGQKKLIRDLSAGNKQKVGIIAALFNKPQLVVLDEPFNFLDPKTQNVLKKLLTAYNIESGATILVSSHNLQHTVDVSHRIALMENGRIIRDIDNKTHQAEAELEAYFQV